MYSNWVRLINYLHKRLPKSQSEGRKKSTLCQNSVSCLYEGDTVLPTLIHLRKILTMYHDEIVMEDGMWRIFNNFFCSLLDKYLNHANFEVRQFPIWVLFKSHNLRKFLINCNFWSHQFKVYLCQSLKKGQLCQLKKKKNMNHTWLIHSHKKTQY